MTFHLSSEFQNAVEATAKSHNLEPAFIEKDYWVTFVLKNIALSEYRNHVVFKGGTSLSKAYRCIERFSEDVDLALLKSGEESITKVKKMVKEIEKIATQNLVYQPDSRATEGGNFRKTYWQYPKYQFDSPEIFPVGEFILLEVNSFTTPVPYKTIEISSYIAEFLTDNGFSDFIQTYDLQPFSLQVLSLERTFFEKLLALTRLSYEGQDRLKEKIRHFYDLHQLFNLPDLGQNLFDEEHLKLIENIQHDDKSNAAFRGEWEGKRLIDAPLITQFDEIWKTLTPTYERELSELVWGELPSASAIDRLFQKIKMLLIAHNL